MQYPNQGYGMGMPGGPGMPQPQYGMGQPGMPQPGMGQPGMGMPGGPGMPQPQYGMGQPGMPQSGMGQPGLGQPGMHGIPMPPANPQLWGARTPWYAVYYNMCAPHTIQQITSWYYSVDADRSGTLDINEIGRALQQAQLNYSYPTLQKIMLIFDLDKSGNINPNEFVCMYQYLCTVKTSFEAYDRDRSGTLNWLELSGALGMLQLNLSPQAINTLITKFDAQRTGQINLEGYTNLCLLLASLNSFYDNKRWQKLAMKNKDNGRVGLSLDDLVCLTPYFV